MMQNRADKNNIYDNKQDCTWPTLEYEGWNFNSGNYLFTTDTK